MKLKPCPFCGQEMLIKKLKDGEVEFYHNLDCVFPPIFTITPDDFIERWNMRQGNPDK